MRFGTNHLCHFALTQRRYCGPGGRSEVRGHFRLAASSAESYEMVVQQGLWAVAEDFTDGRSASAGNAEPISTKSSCR